MDDILKTLHEKLRFSVVSSKNKKRYDIDVVSLGLDDYMEVVVLEDDTSKHTNKIIRHIRHMRY